MNFITRLIEPVYVVKTDAEVDVINGLNKMLIKAGKEPVRVVKITEESILRRAYKFIHNIFVG